MTAREEDDLPTRAEVEQIVHDERIPWDVRRDLALQYVDYIEDEDPDEVGFASDADKDGFRDAMKDYMKISEGDLNGNNFWGGMLSGTQLINSLEDSVQVAYGNAKGYYDKLQEEDRQAQKKGNDDARAGLDQMSAKASATNPGAETSDQILDLGNSSLKSFDIFVPLYNRAVKVVGGAPADVAQLRGLYDEQRKIPFGKFAAGADEFTKLKDAVAGSSGDVSAELNKNLDHWQGSAADQARNYQKNYEAKTKVVTDGAEHAATAMMTAVGSVAKFCRDKAGWMIKFYFDRLGEVTAQDLDRIIRIAELGDNASQDDFKHCARFLDAESQQMIDDEHCDLDEDTTNHIVDEVKKYLRDNFCHFYAGYLKDFTQMCANTHTAVDGAWKSLTDFFGQLEENPFTDLDKSADGSDSGFTTGGGRDSGGSESSGHDGGGGKTVPMGDVPPVNPEIKQPEVPKPPDAGQNVNPVTHQPLEVDPATGQPLPIDPRTGEVVKPGATQPEAVTVEQGGNKISMAEPDKDGRMGVTVDDGAGTLKDYKLDFGDGEAHPQADGTPDMGPRGDAARGAIQHDTVQHQDLPAHAHQPGPDGKIHIEDGKLKITAERPDGAGGPTVVTVDDGSGHPAKYTLGDDPGDGGGNSAAGRPGFHHHAGDHDAAGSSGLRDQPHDDGRGEYRGDLASDGPGRHHAMGVEVSPHDGSSAEPGTNDSTTPQSVFDPTDAHDGVGSGVDNGLGQVADPASTPGGGGSSAPGGTGLGSAPDGVQAAPAGMMGGLMGGMGGAAAGGGEQDQERTSSTYRVEGGLFDEESTGSRISGSLDDEGVIGYR